MHKEKKSLTYYIKQIPEAFEECRPPETSSLPDNADLCIYEPNKGEKIKVLAWLRYPSYDFIFGVPFPSNPKYKDEVGFFQFRDTRTKKKEGFYMDCQELLGMIDGFTLIHLASQINSRDLWNTYNKLDNPPVNLNGKK